MGVTGCYGVHICEVPGRRAHDERLANAVRTSRCHAGHRCRPVGLNQADGQTVDNVKIGVKPTLLIMILGLVYVKRDDETVDKRLFGLVGLFTTVNIFIAVLWT